MTIPEDLKIFNLLYEYRGGVLIPLFTVWAIGGFHFLFRFKKVFFLWLLIFPLFICPLNIAAVYCGWRYRMELRERFARTDSGWSDSHSPHPVNINLMPPEIYAEYAKHDYHPRYRDLKAMAVGAIVFTPLLYALGGLLFVVLSTVRTAKKKD